MPTQRIGDLINIAATLTRMAPADITGQEKYNPIMRVRLAVYKVAADWGVHSAGMIGAAIGGREHSTILHGIRRAETFIERDPAFAALVSKLKAECLKCEPFVNYSAPPSNIALPKPRRRKWISPLCADGVAVNDAGRVFQEGIAKGSDALADAIAQARAA